MKDNKKIKIKNNKVLNKAKIKKLIYNKRQNK